MGASGSQATTALIKGAHSNMAGVIKTAIYIGKPQPTFSRMVIKGVELGKSKCNLVFVPLLDTPALMRRERQLSPFEHIWHLSEQMHPIS